MPCILINGDNGHGGNDFRGGGVGLGVDLMNLSHVENNTNGKTSVKIVGIRENNDHLYLLVH